MGSPAVAAFVAHVMFWALLAWGVFSGDLNRRILMLVVGLWLLAYLGFIPIPYVPFASEVAILDIVLVFAIFKGDVRLDRLS